MKTEETFKTELAAVRERFEQWRQQNGPHRRRIPPALWAAAATLARRYGVFPVARALRLEYRKLKAQSRARERARADRRSAPFVEVAVGPAAWSCPCVVELENRLGARLQIRFATETPPALIPLTKLFLQLQP